MLGQLNTTYFQRSSATKPLIWLKTSHIFQRMKVLCRIATLFDKLGMQYLGVTHTA